MKKKLGTQNSSKIFKKHNHNACFNDSMKAFQKHCIKENLKLNKIENKVKILNYVISYKNKVKAAISNENKNLELTSDKLLLAIGIEGNIKGIGIENLKTYGMQVLMFYMMW